MFTTSIQTVQASIASHLKKYSFTRNILISVMVWGSMNQYQSRVLTQCWKALSRIISILLIFSAASGGRICILLTLEMLLLFVYRCFLCWVLVASCFLCSGFANTRRLLDLFVSQRISCFVIFVIADCNHLLATAAGCNRSLFCNLCN